MDENVPLPPVVICASMALTAMYYNQPEEAERWLRQIPRSARGEVKIALDNLDMAIGRLGKQ